MIMPSKTSRLDILFEDWQGRHGLLPTDVEDTLASDTDTTETYPCSTCGTDVPFGRYMIGYTTCLRCGEREAQEARKLWCVAPLNKSNYVLITDPTLLRGLNPKRTI
jgi:hypothetical protein